jgi:predicted membrane-bound spermidine synthase
LWDAKGLLFSGILWPLYMKSDPTSWQFFAPRGVALAARAVILAALGVLWLRFVLGREQRLFWTLAVSATLVLLASGFLRNGYIPWASLWTVTAIAEAFAARSDARRPQIENL